MKNSFVNFKHMVRYADHHIQPGVSAGFLSLPIYDPTAIMNMKKYLNKLDRKKYKGIYVVSNNTCLEKISWEIYKSSNYWDLLMLLNDIDPIIGMPYDFDIISESSKDSVKIYEQKIYGSKLSDADRERFHLAMTQRDNLENEKHRRIYYIYPSLLYEVRQQMYNEGLLAATE